MARPSHPVPTRHVDATKTPPRCCRARLRNARCISALRRVLKDALLWHFGPSTGGVTSKLQPFPSVIGSHTARSHIRGTDMTKLLASLAAFTALTAAASAADL
ncbi:hypothetical protein ACLBYG_31505, partial [Methylobacterium sp. D53M]